MCGRSIRAHQTLQSKKPIDEQILLAMPGIETLTPQNEASTVKEAASLKSLYLNLSGTELVEAPDCSHLRRLNSLNLSNNGIKTLVCSVLPRNLTELRIQGCNLTHLPKELPTLVNLKIIHAGTNRLENIDIVFKCPRLQHAGAAYNNVRDLPQHSEIFKSSSLISLDMGYNSLRHALHTCKLLSDLPYLQNLNLSGNPMCLLPSYADNVKASLKGLKYFDHMKLDALAQKYANESPPPLHPEETAIQDAQSNEDKVQSSYLYLEILDLRPCEDPFKEAREVIAQQAAASATVPTAAGKKPASPAGRKPATPVATAGAAGKGPKTPASGTSATAAAAPVPLPMLPVYYHIDLIDAEGTTYACVPVKMVPPTTPEEEAAAAAPGGTKSGDKAAKGGKPASTAASKSHPPVGSEVEGGVGALQRGRLRVQLEVVNTVECRDWLRRGLQLRLFRTTLTAVPKSDPQLSFEVQAPPPAGKAAAANKADPSPEVQPPPYDITTEDAVIGTGIVVCQDLVSGHVSSTFSPLTFIPVPELWDKTGVRLGLKDERHIAQPVATATVSCHMHKK
ncbi:hypothetical protein CEUSTIGMA_g2123.t1 [Chlamydomonas eustigma]|uniref:Uncharacterized protein n=1 Tax=Chlamydomonas eustigma TaxID=1157962 RepID=A0A250WV48_9CHLO|nr:hypothetical protein CEUSTIGMA_g2123.t1 [Chlamydomonas eustigma]|eukprot:GAX74675.1 hypothetical protein CEUSTIGMA_g2123.t1 [Chlamydomonas eustigma]